MIRVLQVVTYMGRGGLETMLMNYYRNIDREQIQFDFLVHREERYDYDDEIEALGGKIFRLPLLNPFSVQYRKALYDFFENHAEYKVVHVHQDCMSAVILKAAKKSSVPVRIAHSHSSSQVKSIKLPIKLFYKQLIPLYATNYMACSEKAGSWMFGEHKFQILQNAIDVGRYSYNCAVRSEQRQKYNVGNEILIGHVGRFARVKNHDYLIDVFCEVKKYVAAKLLLVGGKSGRPEEEENYNHIVEKVKRLGLENSVIFAGSCDNVNEILQAVDVFILPSFFEGLGIVAIEAQAAGIPCIISDTVSAEACITKETIKLSLHDTPEVWASKAIELSRLPRRNTYEEICDAGYDIVSNAKKLETFYRTVAEEN